MYAVSGDRGEQQAVFASAEVHALFYIRVHEFVAASTKVPASLGGPKPFSLLSAGEWIATRHPERAEWAGLKEAQRRAQAWFDQTHRIVFWAGSLGRHLRLELPMTSIVGMRSNLEKHQLLRLDREIRRLQSKCVESGCALSLAQAVAAREEFNAHIRGMLAYHATFVAESLGSYFLALYRFVHEIYLERPTNVLKQILPLSETSDEVFRYMYASTISGLSAWTEERIKASIPSISPSFRPEYPQHAEWTVVDSERTDT